MRMTIGEGDPSTRPGTPNHRMHLSVRFAFHRRCVRLYAYAVELTWLERREGVEDRWHDR